MTNLDPRVLLALVSLVGCVGDTPHLTPTRGSPPLESPPPRDGPFEAADGAAAWVSEMQAEADGADAEPDPRTDSPAWEAFFDPTVVHEVTLELSEEAWDALEDDGRTWVPALVTVDGVEFPYAGIHRKGNTTWQSMYGKPSLKIKLREFGEGPRVAGLDKLTLNNMVSDPAQAREVVALQLWRALGVTAARASWATVTINGEPYGLYSNIESIDDEWLGRRYVRPGGDLWEANDDADFTGEGLPYWELSEGAGDMQSLETLREALEAGDGAFEARVGDLVNLEQFHTYFATCLATGSSDGYPFHLNDVYVYADPGDGGRLHFIPWSMDEAWGDAFSTWYEGELAAQCDDDDGCAERQRARIAEQLDAVDALDVTGMFAQAYALTDTLMRDDPRRPYTLLEVQAARQALTVRATAWPGMVRAQLGL